jgi:hypothetical protein
MNPEDIKASRNTDALVGEKVMGWTKHRNDRAETAVESGKVDWEYDWVPPQFNGDTGYNRALPNYSTDIAAAWTVAEKLGLSVINTKEVYYACVPGDIVNAHMSHAIMDGSWALANTAQLAICRAALKIIDLQASAKTVEQITEGQCKKGC